MFSGYLIPMSLRFCKEPLRRDVGWGSQCGVGSLPPPINSLPFYSSNHHHTALLGPPAFLST
jgi:hypothetical protein